MKKSTSQISVYIMLINLAVLFSCRSREQNYIVYYNKVNKIDSIYRIANKPVKAIRRYKRLFRNYQPKNQERIEEYATYIKLSDKNHKNFGGQKSLYRLLPLIAPYNKKYTDFFDLYQKYGIDSITVKNKISHWRKNLNKQLIDSFTIAMIRDQEGRNNPRDPITTKINVEKNAKLLLWTFKNFGYPSMQKIGNIGNDNIFLAMHTFLTHMNESEEYPKIKSKLLEYVESGDCPPISYAMMIDNYNYIHHENSVYGFSFSSSKDSLQINRNRKLIGLPSLKHYDRIRKDFFKKK
ncbi:hypothetical protein [Chryseobacterium gossypii]|uniref:hypothetical protein n=1 Tax=Chryseobacterium gossypii TaxID=3231602 RepID=UPI003524C9E6